MPVDRAMLDLRDSLRAVVERNPKERRRALDDRTAQVLDEAAGLLDSVEAVLQPADETPGERLTGRRDHSGQRDQRSPGQRTADNARSLARDTHAAAQRRRREAEMTPGTRGSAGADTLVEDARRAAARRKRSWS